MRALLVAAAVALAAVRGAAAADCLTPLHSHGGWRCRAHLSNGQKADFCLEHTNTFGEDPATRSFKLHSTGLHLSTCTCGPKGRSPGVDFGAAKSLLCYDPESDTLTSGTVSRRKIAGQTFAGSDDVRSTFSCRPDPTCDVPPVVEPDLPAAHGSVVLTLPPAATRTPVAGGGRIDVDYLGGACEGFASEEPTLTVDVQPSVAGQIVFFLERVTPATGAGLLVVTPSGEARCNDGSVAVPLEAGPHDVWITSDVAGASVEAELVAIYDQK